MKKILFASLLIVSFATQAQDLKKNEIQKEVVRILDSINSVNKEKQAENEKLVEKEKAEKTKADKESWYNKISIRGYVQVRYNGLLSTNDKVSCDQCDKSWGTTSTAPDAKSNNGFFIRRARIIFSGQVHPNVYVYIQPDFASSPSSGINHFAQLRDAYADISFDKKREFRVRIGQSKVPYGFENMQSSQNRLSLDRNDAMNSAVANERDLGAFFIGPQPKSGSVLLCLLKRDIKVQEIMAYLLSELIMVKRQTNQKPIEIYTL